MKSALILFTLFAFVACGGPQSGPGNSAAEAAAEMPSDDQKKAELVHEAKAQLGEGAFWDSASQQFLWIDIEGKQLHQFDPVKGTNLSFDLPSRPGTVVPSEQGDALVALEDGIYRANLQNGALERFSDVEREMTANRFNDGKCDPAGRLWVGSMHLDQSEPAAKLYKIEADGKWTAMYDSVTISNGIVWTKDGTKMYYIDTPRGQILGFDYDVESGEISNERVAVEVPDSLGYPDGMAIDAADKLWVGMWNGYAVARFDPLSGQLMERISVPAKNVTACAFGGPDLSTLYITTASVDMTPEELKMYPLAGSVFQAEPGVKGVRSAAFAH